MFYLHPSISPLSPFPLPAHFFYYLFYNPLSSIAVSQSCVTRSPNVGTYHRHSPSGQTVDRTVAWDGRISRTCLCVNRKKKKKEERRVKLLSECNLNLRLPACARSCPAQHRSFTTHQRKDGGVRQKQTDVSLLFFLSIFQK